MAFQFDQSAANQISKEVYTEKDTEVLSFQSALAGLVPKWTGGGGLQYTGALGNAILTSMSTQDTIAFTSGSASSYERFICQWKENFVSCNLTGMAIDQTRTDKLAMIKAITQEMDNGYRSCGVYMGRALYGNGGGAIGYTTNAAPTTTYIAGDTVQLVNPSQAVQLLKNQIINVALTDGTSGTVATGAGTIVARNVQSGSVTLNVAWTSAFPGYFTSGTYQMYLFNQGDFGNYPPGLAGWLPDGNNRPLSTDNFNNVNRSTDPEALAGAYILGKSAPYEETLIQAALEVAKYGGKPTHCFLNPKEFAKLSKGLTGRVSYMTEQAFENPLIGFPMVTVNTPVGPIKLVQDTYCSGPKYNNAYMLNLDEWVFPSMGALPKNLTEELTGLIWIPQTNRAAFQSQVGMRWTTFCAAPGHQIVITW